MTATPIADHWTELEQQAGIVMADADREILRAMYFAGAMSALSHLTGFDPVNGNDYLRLDIVALDNLCAELILAYHATDDMLRRVEH